jgi:WD40 repeat protein
MAASISCSKKIEIHYKELSLANKCIEYISRNIPYNINDLKRKQDRIFLSCRGVYEINLREKTEKLLFKNGAGPDEIYEPYLITMWDGNIYINSYLDSKSIYKFNPDSQRLEIERVNIGNTKSFNGFGFISENLMVMANVNWYDGLVRIYDLEKDTFKKIGTPTYVKAMEKFNVSAVYLCIDDGLIYLAERIKPEIKIISAEQAKIVKSLILSPPFYIPIPLKYTAKKYDDKAHREWMASWTSVSNIMLNNGWLLVQYRWGYDFLFAYELINLKDTDNRFYIDKTTDQIYDFSLEGKDVRFYLVERPEEGDLKWKTAEASIR